MCPRGNHLRSQAGFTIVEVLAAMVVLLIGMGGALKVYEGVATTSAAAKLREQGVSLQRELVEASRALKYNDLGPGTIVSRLQAQPGLADAAPGTAGWQLRRRGVTYTVAVGACTVDDARDGTGARATPTFCATGAGSTPQATCATLLGSSGDISGTATAASPATGDCGLDVDRDGQVDGLVGGGAGAGADDNADDYKRIVVLVRGKRGGGARYVLQDSTVPSPGAADAVQITGLALAPGALITSAGTTEVVGTATTNRAAATVSWSVDGELGDPGAMTGAGSTWRYRWALGNVTGGTAGTVPAAGEVLDGAYLLSARAYDEYGIVGPERAESVVLDRRRPFTVPGQVLRNDGTSILVGWTASRERDITRYRVFREKGSTKTLICEVTAVQPCRDSAPLSGASQYYVVAVDGADEGDGPAGKLAASTGGSIPDAPTGAAATTIGTGVRVSWTAPESGAASYRIYRDGTAIGDLLGATSGTSFTDTTPGSEPRTYYVAALSNQGVESQPTGPVAP
jgi:prepilin-type N-terminal cleavage/methylation domain-containing protein